MSFATENFDSYTNGASITGLNGGSGWSAAWVVGPSSGATSTVSNAQFLSSPNSAASSTPLSGVVYQTRARNAPILTAGTFQFSTLFDNSSHDYINGGISTVGQGNGVWGTIQDSAALGRFRMEYNGGTYLYASIVTPLANTWYSWVVNYDTTTGSCSVNINGAGLETFTLASTGWTPTEFNFQMGGQGPSAPGVFYIDDISVSITQVLSTASNRRAI